MHFRKHAIRPLAMKQIMLEALDATVVELHVGIETACLSLVHLSVTAVSFISIFQPPFFCTSSLSNALRVLLM